MKETLESPGSESTAHDRPDQSDYSHIEGRNPIDHMLRTVQLHHVQLGIMVDQKANIMIGATLVLLTLLLGQMVNSGLELWSLVLMLFILAAAVCALLAAMPTVKSVDPQSEQFNPLFFGHFAALQQERYVRHMEQLIANDGQIYRAMVINIYQIGQVLYYKKYRYLSWSYKLFLVGAVLALLSFIIPQLHSLSA